MVQKQTKRVSSDNSGARNLRCIRVIKSGGSERGVGKIGELVLASVRRNRPNSKVRKGEIYKCLLIRTKRQHNRLIGHSLRFNKSSVVLLDDKNQPRGTRIFGPVPKELRRRGFSKVISLASRAL